ncbi:unnamed protein product [Ranitomeya imitator]|uniref:Major facilitator superfamily (MFS) profile domain-containing protein n=1 Tax=Ranitomeya imitator TaxID=111125 RepID=A0ABN9LTP4_9NEOB|nr:unnamed protein product [Ranitomeya imitator]
MRRVPAAMTKQEPPQSPHRVITAVFLALLIDLLGFTLILPLLPSILDHYSKSNDGLYHTLQHTVDWFAAAVGVPQERKYNSVLFGVFTAVLQLQFYIGAVVKPLRNPQKEVTYCGMQTAAFPHVFFRSMCTAFLVSHRFTLNCKFMGNCCGPAAAETLWIRSKIRIVCTYPESLVGSLFSLLQFICSPLTGAASDYAGRRRLMMITTVGLIVSYALWAVSRSFGVFLISRIIGGLSKGNVSLCTAIIADLPSLKDRSKGMAMIGVAFSLGFTIGPMVGAYFAMNLTSGELFYVRPALLALLFAVIDLVFIFLLLPETLPKENRVSSMMVGFQGASDLLSPVSLFQFSAVTRRKDRPCQESLQNLRILGLVYFLYLFLFSGLEYTISFLTHQRFQFSSMQQGKMFFFIGITMAVIQGGYARRIKPGNEVKAVKRRQHIPQRFTNYRGDLYRQ